MDKTKILRASNYFKILNLAFSQIEVTSRVPNDHSDYLIPLVMSIDDAVDLLIETLRQKAVDLKKRIMIIGNGGSASIAIHMLMDYVKTGNLRTMDFNSPSLLTCMANDYGYENVFAKPIDIFAD